MENKINIAEILHDMPRGTKLYSPIFGDVELKVVKVKEHIECPITVSVIDTGKVADQIFTENGLYRYKYVNAETTLFPSRKMRDWTKFFKRGDVLYIKEANYIISYAIFESWKNDDYTEFNASIFYSDRSGFAEKKVCTTKLYTKANNTLKKSFISSIERYFNGKYNPETLKVETIKSECDFKPFDKVLVRDNVNETWITDFFERLQDDSHVFHYKCMFSIWKFCIPYEGNEHLLGTTNNPSNYD